MNKRTVKTYSPEFKQSSAKLAAESGQPIAQIARELDVHVTTLHGWINKYVHTANPSNDSNPHEELKRLRKENSRLREERDILKKATAYFAKEIK